MAVKKDRICIPSKDCLQPNMRNCGAIQKIERISLKSGAEVLTPLY